MFKVEFQSGQVRGHVFNMPGGIDGSGKWKKFTGQTPEQVAVDTLAELETALVNAYKVDAVVASMATQYAVHCICMGITDGMSEQDAYDAAGRLMTSATAVFAQQLIGRSKYGKELLADLPPFRETTKEGMQCFTFGGMDVVPCCASCNAWVIVLGGTNTILVDKTDMPSTFGSNVENMKRVAWWLSHLDVPKNIYVKGGNPAGRDETVKARFMSIIQGIQQEDYEAVYAASLGWGKGPPPGEKSPGIASEKVSRLLDTIFGGKRPKNG